MGDKTKSVMRYIVKNYPYAQDLTKTRITKLVYLADLENINAFNRQITDIKWYFDHYGPYVSDVLDAADTDKYVKIRKTTSNFGTIKYTVEPKSDKDQLTYDDLSDEDKSSIDKVIKTTKDLTWNQFIDYVYSTDPIKKSHKYSYLNLADFRK